MKNSSEEINYLTVSHIVLYPNGGAHYFGLKISLIEKENVFSVVYHAESVF